MDRCRSKPVSLNNQVNKALSNGEPVSHTRSLIEQSAYVDFTSVIKGVQRIEIYFDE
jgi:hypothetical protein